MCICVGKYPQNKMECNVLTSMKNIGDKVSEYFIIYFPFYNSVISYDQKQKLRDECSRKKAHRFRRHGWTECTDALFLSSRSPNSISQNLFH